MMSKYTDVPIRDAATIVLLRDGAQGLETLLLQRNGTTVFGPGHFVFPGGAVDVADADPVLQAHCDGLSDTEASRQLGVEQDGLAFWVAVVRECFEESGLLLATDGAGHALNPERDYTAERNALNDGSLSFAALCQQADLRLPMSRLVYYTHWVTPLGAPRRFDTRFFIGAAPTHDRPMHDGEEIVASNWQTPQAALAAHEAGCYQMMNPTITQLRFLAQQRCVDDALATLAVQPVSERGPYIDSNW